MTQTADEFLSAPPVRNEDRVPRDRWGRYLVVPEGESKAVPHQRVTTLAKMLEDTFGLARWDTRMTARGLALRPDLLLKLSATPDDDKAALDAICAQAKEAAAGSAGANSGQALHTATERADLGEDVRLPAPWDKDLEAYRTTLAAAGMEIVPGMVERYVVLPELGVAGTLDRIVSFGSKPVVADLKTGSIEYSQGANACQLALYAHARSFYDFETKRHTPMIEVDQTVALLIHLPAGKARCDLYWIDIAAGWEAVQHALWVRDWRKRKDLMDPWAPATRLDSVIERRTGLEARVDALRAIPGALAALAQTWPAGLPTLKQSTSHTPEQLTLIADLLTAIESRFRAPFGPLDASNVIPLNRTQETP